MSKTLPQNTLEAASNDMLIQEVIKRKIDFDTVFPGHSCEEFCDLDHNHEINDDLIETVLEDEHQLQSGQALFGIQIAYEHLCKGDQESAAKTLHDAVPSLPSPEQQKRLLQETNS